VQKLTGILIGLNAELAATDKELDHAASVNVVQNAAIYPDLEVELCAFRG
jgi:hypothetical protein